LTHIKGDLEMADIIIPSKKKNILDKDCSDFQPIEDGTKSKEKKYCALSDLCRQVGMLSDGTFVPMESHYLPVIPIDGGEIMEWKYLCTGLYDLRSIKERIDDDKVS
jgi:hypothetical protein